MTSAFTSNGVCVTTSGSAITLTSAYSEVLPSADGQVTIDTDGQQGFINFLGFTTCSGGGENFVPTALLQIMNTTATTTSTFTNVPLAAAVASLTIAPVSVSVRVMPTLSPKVFSHLDLVLQFGFDKYLAFLSIY